MLAGAFRSRDRPAPWSVLAIAVITVLVGVVLAGSLPLTGGVAPTPGARPQSALGSVPDSLPPDLGSLLFTVSNPTSVATGTFEQAVVVDSADYSAIINSNWTNGAAYYTGNATPIYTWIESGASNASAQTLLWLRLYSIAPHSQVGVALRFVAKSSFDLSEKGYVGESPLLSRGYGEFDNGWKVFNFYDNFSGTSLSSHWAVHGGWTYSVDDGANVTFVPGDGGYISSTASFAYPEAVDFYGDLFDPETVLPGLIEGIGTSSCTACDNGSSVGFDAGGGYVLDGPAPGVADGGSYGGWDEPAFSSQTYAVFTSIALGSLQAAFEENYSNLDSYSGPVPGSPEPVTLASSGDPSGSTATPEHTYWIRERTWANTSVSGLSLFQSVPVVLEALPGTLGVGQSLSLLVTGPPLPPGVNYSYRGLPPGCRSVDAPYLSCVVNQSGEFQPTVVASDALGDTSTGTTNVTVTVPSTPPPPVLEVGLTSFNGPVPFGSPVLVVASATGGVLPYSFTYGGLPDGCSTVNASSLSCVPTASGSFTLTVNVVDAQGDSAHASTGLTVATAVVVAPAPALAVGLTSFSGPFVTGAELTITASVTGGQSPYSYSFSGLPTGCASANVSSVSCVPTATGTYSISVSVRDSTGHTATASTSLVLNAPASPTTASSSGGSLSTTDLAALGAGVALAVVLGVVALVRSGRRGATGPP